MMRKIILILLLTLISNSASAEWVRLGTRFFDGKKYSDEIYYEDDNPDESFTGFTIYANLSTTRKNGSIIKMWSLISLSKPMEVLGKEYMSIESLDEYNCSDRTSRPLTYRYTSEKMGEGRAVIKNSRPGKWYPVSPVTFTAILWNAACKK